MVEGDLMVGGGVVRYGPIAHLAEDGRVHPLEKHLRATAERAGGVAAEFGCAEWGRLAGLWHMAKQG